MNFLWKLFSSKERLKIIEMIEKDLDSDKQEIRIGRYRDRIVNLLLYFERNGRKFVISVNDYWIEIHTESNERFGKGLMSHRVDSFRIPDGMYQGMLGRTTEMKNRETEEINRINRREQHKQKMINMLYGGSDQTENKQI